MSGAISRVTILITRIRGRITPLITTHEPPSGGRHVKTEFHDLGSRVCFLGFCRVLAGLRQGFNVEGPSDSERRHLLYAAT